MPLKSKKARISSEGDAHIETELRRKYEHIMGGTPKWAINSPEGDENSDSDDDQVLFARKQSLVENPKYLGTDKLDYTMLDARIARRRQSIMTVQFNPKSRMLLTTGRDNLLQVFEIDGSRVSVVSSFAIADFPLTSGRFAGTDFDKIILMSRYRHFLDVLDLKEGTFVPINLRDIGYKPTRKLHHLTISRDGGLAAVIAECGFIYVISCATGEVVKTFKVSVNVVSDATFSADSQFLIAVDGEAEIYVFSLLSNVVKKCVQKFTDVGSYGGRMSIACSPNNKYLAVGSHTGVTNVYRVLDSSGRGSWCSEQPAQVFKNIRVPVEFVSFNHTGDILVMGAAGDNNCIKIAHCSSGRIYSNFPKQILMGTKACKTRYTCCDISPNSGYLAMGAESGAVEIARLNFFNDY